MRNILKIALDDFNRVRTNVIVIIICIGLVIVPTLYAWFNIAASWDPYKNTGNLKVAVANNDVGYQGTLIPLDINIGDSVVSSLRASTTLNWIVTDESSAVTGVKDGTYYAAIVIPESFSRDMMSLFTSDVTHSDILYYSNEKENAIAPKVTDKGTSAVQKQIDENFTSTIVEIGLNLLEDLTTAVDDESAVEMLENFNTNILSMQGDIDGAVNTLSAFSEMLKTLGAALDTTSGLLDATSEGSSALKELLSETESAVANAKNAKEQTIALMDGLFSQTDAVYQNIQSQLESQFPILGTDSATIQSTLLSLGDESYAILTQYTNLRDRVQALDDAIPDDMTLAHRQLATIIGRLDSTVEQQTEIHDRIVSAANSMAENASDIESARQQLNDLVASIQNAATQIRSDYTGGLQNDLNALESSITSTKDSTSNLLSSLDDTRISLGETLGSLSDDLVAIEDLVDSTIPALENISDLLGQISEALVDAKDGDALTTLKNILGSDPDEISSFLSAPVALNTIKLYPVENYGSAMAPFYSLLAIWVGAICLAAMLKVDLEDKRRKQLWNLKEYQVYLGRHVLFTILGFLQTLLICLGDLYFLGIQCVHPVLFVFAGLVSSLVFVNICYTLTVAFGDIGKAIAVILLVMQVAGSGGTFPIEMTPKFFQAVYPLLPFTHAMASMREAIAGLYGNVYWEELGYTMIYMVICLAIGLFLRVPIIKLNNKFAEKLEDTKVI